MKIDMTDLLNSITENLKRIDYIKPEEIPNIDLYGSGNNFYGRTSCRNKTP